MHDPGGGSAKPYDVGAYYGDRVHLDGSLAPRRMRYTGKLCWVGMGKTEDERQQIQYRGEEYPQGQFLLHHLSNGYTAIQWWDRNQGDERGACNSTILLEGVHTSEEVLVAGREHFPHVFENLKRAGIELVEVRAGIPVRIVPEGKGSNG